MMNHRKNVLVRQLVNGFFVLGTIVVACASAGALNFAPKLASTANGVVQQAFSSRESTILLVVAGALIVLGSSLRWKLSTASAREPARQSPMSKAVAGKP